MLLTIMKEISMGKCCLDVLESLNRKMSVSYTASPRRERLPVNGLSYFSCGVTLSLASASIDFLFMTTNLN